MQETADQTAESLPGGAPATSRAEPVAEVTGSPGGGGRWAAAVLAGVAAGVPVGWLLSYGALLPFYLGLFFFTLFGLLVGAVIYRVALPLRPLPRGRLALGSAVAMTATWTFSVMCEARHFPEQIAQIAIEQATRLPEDSTPQAFRRRSAADVASHLREAFPPGGTIGYMRWAVASSRLDPPVGLLRRPHVARQAGLRWVVRAVLSAVLLGYGIYSQVGGLARPPSRAERAGAAVNPLSKI